MKKFKHLVFVDDDHPTNVFHEIIVEESGLSESSEFFLSPEEALLYLKKQGEKDLPEIIFLDINMPRMDGWEFIDHLQKLDLPHIPPIVLLTTSHYNKDIERAEKNSLIHSLITKPLEVSHLQRLSEELFNGQ